MTEDTMEAGYDESMIEGLYSDVPQEFVDDATPQTVLNAEDNAKIKNEVWYKDKPNEKIVEVTTFRVPCEIEDMKGTEVRNKEEDELFQHEMLDITFKVPDDIDSRNAGRRFHMFFHIYRGAGTEFSEEQREAAADELSKRARGLYGITRRNMRALATLWQAAGFKNWLLNGGKTWLGIKQIPEYNGINPMLGTMVWLQIRQLEGSNGELQDDLARATAYKE